MPSKEQRDLDWGKLIDTALTVEGSVGSTYNRLYNYSFLNQMFLMMQGVLEPVATYKRWQEVGRQVVKGSKAKEIVRPVFIEKKDEHGEVEDTLLRFKPVKCIFGLSETEGDDLPPADIPAWDYAQALDDLEIREVPFQSLNGNSQGYSVDRDIAVNPLAVYPDKTRFHEVGHVVLGHTSPERQGEYARHRGVFEFQAEAVAHLTMNELEQLTPEMASVSRGYLQSWLQGERPSDVTIRQVFSATDKILRAGRVAIEAPEALQQTAEVPYA